MTPLHAAAMSGSVACATLLLEAQASILTASSDGRWGSCHNLFVRFQLGWCLLHIVTTRKLGFSSQTCACCSHVLNLLCNCYAILSAHLILSRLGDAIGKPLPYSRHNEQSPFLAMSSSTIYWRQMWVSCSVCSEKPSHHIEQSSFLAIPSSLKVDVSVLFSLVWKGLTCSRRTWGLVTFWHCCCLPVVAYRVWLLNVAGVMSQIRLWTMLCGCACWHCSQFFRCLTQASLSLTPTFCLQPCCDPINPKT